MNWTINSAATQIEGRTVYQWEGCGPMDMTTHPGAAIDHKSDADPITEAAVAAAIEAWLADGEAIVRPQLHDSYGPVLMSSPVCAQPRRWRVQVFGEGLMSNWDEVRKQVSDQEQRDRAAIEARHERMAEAMLNEWFGPSVWVDMSPQSRAFWRNLARIADEARGDG